MKNVPIKFRGQQLTADKDFVYGDLIQYPYDLPVIRVFDDEECKKGIYAFDDYEVYPESVAQLVGYDADGNEVYEGDTLELIKEEYTIKAKLEANVNLPMFRKVVDNVYCDGDNHMLFECKNEDDAKDFLKKLVDELNTMKLFDELMRKLYCGG